MGFGFFFETFVHEILKKIAPKTFPPFNFILGFLDYYSNSQTQIIELHVSICIFFLGFGLNLLIFFILKLANRFGISFLLFVHYF